jgi:ABC-type lipoprotein export system ATPase subunit
MTAGKDSRGSEWRKWDLHLHCPGTKLADGFGVTDATGWHKYCELLHKSDVHAFGITDYFSIDGYEKCVAEYKSRYPDCTKQFFPNIELRSTDVVNKADQEVNIHLLFNPSIPGYLSKAKEFLLRLKTSKTVSGGAPVHAANLSSKKDYEEATAPRQSITDALEMVYGKDADLSEFVLIVTAANNDGIRADSGSKRKQLISDEVDKFSDGFFGNQTSSDYFLDKKRLEDKSQTVAQKPAFTGCDAHCFDDLENGLGKIVNTGARKFQPTWIKADVTFEGLKQTLFEPAERVFIGEEPEVHRRVRENETRYIQALHVTCVDGYASSSGRWFHNEKIPLNQELVAIIGNKGSGKSALADIAGLLGNSHNQKGRAAKGQDTLFSFLNEQKFLKTSYASNFNGELHWYAGTPDKRRLDAQCDVTLPEKVEYLPQKYLERICANVEYAEFEATLKEVIFGYVPVDEQFGRATFDELIAYLTQQVDQGIKAIRGELHTANERVADMERKLSQSYGQELAERIRLKQEELAAHETHPPPEKPKPEENVPEGIAKALQENTELIAQTDMQIAALDNERHQASSLLEELRQAKQRIERTLGEIAALDTTYADLFTSAGLAFKDVISVSVDWEGFDQIIATRTHRLAELKSLLATSETIELMATETERKAATEKSLICKKSALDGQKSELIEQLGKPQREYEEYRRLYGIWAQRSGEIRGNPDGPAAGTLAFLQAEATRILDEYPKTLAELQAARNAISRKVFESKRGLTAFYDSVKSAIEGEITKHRSDLGDYAISIDAELSFAPVFFEDFFRFVAQNKAGTFYGRDEGRAALQRFASSVSDWEGHDQVDAFLTSVCDALQHDRRPHMRGERSTIESQLRDRRTVTEVYDYLYGFEYLEPKYELKVDGKHLSALSPGERGGLLLVFYLMLDRRDIPLIIDQPEDNLDNKSVYEILVKFLKKAKKRRQILIVTHNPNLAVVADAEQIIHVTIDKKNQNDFDYVAGAIENPTINALVVDILEGTRPAFDNRRLKYRKPTSA